MAWQFYKPAQSHAETPGGGVVVRGHENSLDPAPVLWALSYCDASSIPPMRIRFARRPPLFRGEKSTKLSPMSADKELDCAAFRRTTPAARLRPSSSKRARADILSAHKGLGPETGVEISLSIGAPFGLLPYLGCKRRWYSSYNNGLRG